MHCNKLVKLPQIWLPALSMCFIYHIQWCLIILLKQLKNHKLTNPQIEWIIWRRFWFCLRSKVKFFFKFLFIRCLAAYPNPVIHSIAFLSSSTYHQNGNITVLTPAPITPKSYITAILNIGLVTWTAVHLETSRVFVPTSISNCTTSKTFVSVQNWNKCLGCICISQISIANNFRSKRLTCTKWIKDNFTARVISRTLIGRVMFIHAFFCARLFYLKKKLIYRIINIYKINAIKHVRWLV